MIAGGRRPHPLELRENCQCGEESRRPLLAHGSPQRFALELPLTKGELTDLTHGPEVRV
jgi:hypothetical protein